MRKKAWTDCASTLILAAFGMLLRWLQLQMGFEAESGLLIPGAAINRVMGVFLVFAAVFLWFLSRHYPREDTLLEPGAAFDSPPKALSALLLAAALLVFAGSLLLYFTSHDILLQITAMLGILSAPALLLYPHLPKWGGLGVLWGSIPIALYSFWLVVSYKEHAVNPTVWSYAVQILAIAAGLLAVYYLAGYLFEKAKPRRAVFACSLAIVLGMAVLPDDNLFALQLLFFGWSAGYLALAFLLISNFSDTEKPGASPAS